MSARRTAGAAVVRAIGAALVASAMLASAPRPARAYVRATNEGGVPVYWPTACEAVTIYMNGFTQMTEGAVAKSIAAAAAAWSSASVVCPGADAGGGPSFEVIPAIATGGGETGYGYDGKNSIVFEPEAWSTENPPDAIAFTVRFTSPDGRILDADMEINATSQSYATWANLDPSVPAEAHGIEFIDLQTAITHELGHFLGLAHTCFNTTDDVLPRPTNDEGQPIPDCANPAPDIPEARAVMWYHVDQGSTAKRVLSADDVAGLCAIYPPARAVPACALNQPDDGCACGIARQPRRWTTGSFGLVALLVWFSRRRPLRRDPYPRGRR